MEVTSTPSNVVFLWFGLKLIICFKKKKYCRHFLVSPNFYSCCGSLPVSNMTSEWCYCDYGVHIGTVIHCYDDILNIDVEPEYIIGNDKRKHDLISSMPLSPLKLLRVMPSQCILIISNRISWCSASIYGNLQEPLCWICFVCNTTVKGFLIWSLSNKGKPLK